MSICQLSLLHTYAGNLAQDHSMSSSLLQQCNEAWACCLQSNRAAVYGLRTGAVNLLIATDVTAEGLDAVSCSLVIHFTLPRTAQELMQSRKMARNKGARVLLMQAKDDWAQQRLLHLNSM